MAVEVEESPPHPASTAVHLQCCKCCFPCVQGLAKREEGDESDFPFPSSLWDQVLQDLQGLLSKMWNQGQNWCLSFSWANITGFVPVQV